MPSSSSACTTRIAAVRKSPQKTGRIPSPMVSAIRCTSITACLRLSPMRTNRCEMWLWSPIQNGLWLRVRISTTIAVSNSGSARMNSGIRIGKRDSEKSIPK